MLVEKSAYAEDLNALQELVEDVAKKAAKKKKPGGSKKKGTAKEKRVHAEARGLRRGWSGAEYDAVLAKTEPQRVENADNEGLFVLVQTGVCRRQVLTKIFKNEKPRKLSKLY